MKHNRMIKAAAVFLVIFMLAAGLGGCRQSTITSYNISKEADNFNVTRRLAVINARTDKPIFELVGKFALSNNSNTNELEIICQTGPNEFKKHYVYLNEWTIYIVEDVSGAHVDSFHYEVNFLPEMFGVVWTQSK